MPLLLCPKQMPRITTWSLYLTLSGFVIWFVVILSMHKHTNDRLIVFQTGQGSSGWNAGTGWLLGIINSMYAFTGTDGAIHIAEEMRSPSRRLPQIMSVPFIVYVSIHY